MHPYKDKPDYQFWKREASLNSDAAFKMPVQSSFTITSRDRIVTAGSCFAQHVARHLTTHDFNCVVTETAPDYVPHEVARKHQYGLFAARYGNIYTPRQLKQLIQRATGDFTPVENHWVMHGPVDGDRKRYIDPLRPQIQPGGFISIEELEQDRTHHLDCVKAALTQMTVFVFTLGLTEAWIDTRDGTVFPLAPGVAGGTYDPESVIPHNFSVTDITEDMQWCLDYFKKLNPGLKTILTVSPVPLNATFENHHVLQSTVYSKSVLRVAAETLSKINDLCDYFPSFEIVNNPFDANGFFAADKRSVTDHAVQTVMGTFFDAYTDQKFKGQITKKPKDGGHPAIQDTDDLETDAEVDVICDEEMLDNQ